MCQPDPDLHIELGRKSADCAYADGYPNAIDVVSAYPTLQKRIRDRYRSGQHSCDQGKEDGQTDEAPVALNDIRMLAETGI